MRAVLIHAPAAAFNLFLFWQSHYCSNESLVCHISPLSMYVCVPVKLLMHQNYNYLDSSQCAPQCSYDNKFKVCNYTKSWQNLRLYHFLYSLSYFMFGLMSALVTSPSVWIARYFCLSDGWKQMVSCNARWHMHCAPFNTISLVYKSGWANRMHRDQKGPQSCLKPSFSQRNKHSADATPNNQPQCNSGADLNFRFSPSRSSSFWFLVKWAEVMNGMQNIAVRHFSSATPRWILKLDLTHGKLDLRIFLIC